MYFGISEVVLVLDLPRNHSSWTNPTHSLGISKVTLNRGLGLCNAVCSSLQVSRPFV